MDFREICAMSPIFIIQVFKIVKGRRGRRRRKRRKSKKKRRKRNNHRERMLQSTCGKNKCDVVIM